MIVITPQDMQQYIASLNSICSSHELSISFTSSDWMDALLVSSGKKIWHINDSGRDKIKSVLFQPFPCLKKQKSVHLYRFLPYSRFDGLFESKSLRMNSMEINRRFNGPGEYEDFFNAISLNYDKGAIDGVAARTYLLCFISAWNRKYMWENYVGNYNGFCIEVDVKPKLIETFFWDFRKVSYQNPANYKFMDDMITQFKQNYGIDIVLPWSEFAYIYKGPKFADEIESRIYIKEPDRRSLFRTNYMTDIGNSYKTEFDSDQNYSYINMPLSNKLFDIDIKKVFLGTNCDSDDINRMKDVLKALSIPFEDVDDSDSRLM